MSLDSIFNITLDSNDASFKILGDEKLRITSLGNVGIGTTSPTGGLHIRKDQDSFPTGANQNSKDGTLVLENAADGSVSTSTDGTVAGYGSNIKFASRWKLNDAAKTTVEMGAIAGYNGFNEGFGGGLTFWTHPNSSDPLVERMRITDTGDIGIGTNVPSRQLTISKSSNTVEQLELRTTGGIYDDQYTGIKFTQNTNGGTTLGYIRCNFQSDGNTVMSFATRGGTTEEKMRIYPNGNVGIGTTSPDGLLDITNAHGSGERGKDQVYSVMDSYFGWRWHSRWHNRYWDIRYNTGGQGDVLHVFYQGDTKNGGFFDPNQDVSTFTFTGQHRNFIENIPSTEAKHYKGLIVSANKNAYYDIDYSIKTGRDAITINDALPYVSLCKTEKDKSCYGVISDGEDEESRKYSSGTFVSVSEKQYGDNRMFINSLGEGAIWVSNKNGNLESGDYITTASIPGYGQKQDSEFLANYTVAKITMDCNFQPDYIYKKKLITRNVHITGPDASGNYYDVLNNERLYTIDLKNEITNNKNKKYTLSFDDADNLIGATQNILDPNGEIQWKDSTEQEYAYDIRYVDATGNIITKQQHDTMIANSQEAYIAAFVGCTYHCG